MARFWLRRLARQFSRTSPARGPKAGRLPRRRTPLSFERLEDRTTPSTLDFGGGVLSYTASTNVGSNFTLSYSGGTYTLSDSAETITVTAAAQAAGFTGSGTNTVTGPDGASLTSLQITLGNLADTANVRSLSKPTALTTGAGNDTINVSSTGLTGNLNGIGASLSIDAGGGANTLAVSNYTATSGDANVVIGGGTITGFAGPSGGSTIGYKATGGTFSLLRVMGSNTPTLSQTFTVNNPAATTFQLNADNGTNTINVEATGGAANIVGGLGKDNIVVCSKTDLTGSLDNIGGALTIDGGQGVNTLTVSDAGTTGLANNATITSTQITGLAGASNNQAINYKSIGGSFGQITVIGAAGASLADQFTLNSPNGPLALDLGAGNDTVNVQALTKAATINGGSGSDTFNVSSDAPTDQGTLNNINGTLTVNAGTGGNVLDVSDYGQTSLADNVTVTGSAITGFAGSAKGTAINYGGAFSSVILTGSHADANTFTVSGGTVAVLQGGNANDTFNLGNGASAKSIDGGAGTNTLSYAAYTTNVNVTLAASSGANGYKSNSATGLSGGFANVGVLTAGSGANNVLTGENVAGTWALASAQTYNDGGGTGLTFSGFQTLDAGSGGDTFNVNANTTANLNGGSGNDTFNLAKGVTLTGTITGGAGTDTLSYAAYTTAVAVTLTGSDSTGLSSTSATGVTSFKGIDVLAGGQGGTDSLTGENVASTWNLGAANTYSDGSEALTFSAFEAVNGSGKGDTFNVSGATDVTAANGGAGNDTFNVSGSAPGLSVAGDGGGDTLSYAGYKAGAVSVTLTGSDATGLSSTSATGLASFKGISALAGGPGGSDSLTGENVASTWNLGAANTYNDGSDTLTFSAFETVNAGSAGDTFQISGATDVAAASGGAGNDTFDINANAALNLAGGGGSNSFNFTKDGVVLTGSIDGGSGSGTDTLSYAGYKSTPVSVTLSGSSATGVSSTSATGVTGFRDINVLVGGQGTTDILTGENVAGTWVLGAANTYSDGSATLAFSAFEAVSAGSAGDTFQINGATDVTAASGGAGNDTFDINANAALNLAGGGGNNSFNFTKDNVVLTGGITGGSGTDTLSYAAYKATAVSVTLTGSDSTGLSSTSATGVTSFAGIDVLVGGQGSTDSLTGENTASTWSLGATNTYSDGNHTLAFSAFETVNGSGKGDTFNVSGATDVTAADGGAGNDTFNVSGSAPGLSVAGDGGSDTLSYAGYKAGAVSVTLTGSDATGLSSTSATGLASFKGISALAGGPGGSDSLTGENVASTWNLGAANTYSDGSEALTFSAFEAVNAGGKGDLFQINGATDVAAANGGAGNDTFDINANAPGLSVAGDGGSDTLSYAGYKAGAVSVTLTGSDATGLSSTSATGLASFKGISALVGGSGGTDSLTGENVASTWNLGAANTYNDGSDTLTFSAFETVNAGSKGDLFQISGVTDVTAASGGSGNDTFDINASATLNLSGGGGSNAYNFTKDGVVLTGGITGGSGTDTLSYAAYKATAVSVTLTGSDATGLSSTSATGVTSFKGIDVLVGGQGGTDSLTGENTARTWNLGAANTYSDGNHTLTFSAFETVNAGTAGDTFNINGATDVTAADGGGGGDTFNINANATLNINEKKGNNVYKLADGAALTGSITGGTGKDTLNYAAYKSAVDLVLSGSSATTGFSSGNATGLTGFSGIDAIIGGLAANNTLTGENAVSTWDVGITEDYRVGGATLTFLGFEQLVGGSAADTFNITVATSTVSSINGGDGNNVFNVSSTATMNLTGGKDNDTFNLGDGVVLRGGIDGGAGTNTLSYADYTTPVAVALTSSAANGYASGSGSTGVSSFKNITALVGGQATTDTLTGENAASTWDLGATQTYDDGAGHGALTFSGFEVLDSGTGNDTFNVTQTTANVPLTLNAGGGDVTFNVSNLANVQGDFTVNGGAGSSGLNVDDSGNAASVGWAITGTTVQQFNAGVITYGNMATVTVATGTPTDGFSNALDVEAVPSGTSLTVQASQTDVTVAQVAQTLAGIQGGLTIDAVGSNVTVTINDSLDTANTNFTINGGTGTVSTDNVSITILDSPTSLVVLGGSGNNNFDVTPSPAFAITVDGGVGGANTLTYHYGSSTTWSDDHNGTISDPGVVQNVYYTDFTTVNHKP